MAAAQANVIAGIKYGRALRRWKQGDLARALTEATGRTWTTEMVSNLERGRLVVDADLLVTLARVQDLPVEFYVYGPAGTLAPGTSAKRRQFNSQVTRPHAARPSVTGRVPLLSDRPLAPALT